MSKSEVTSGPHLAVPTKVLMSEETLKGLGYDELSEEERIINVNDAVEGMTAMSESWDDAIDRRARQNHQDFVAWQNLAKELYLECMWYRSEGDREELMIRAKAMLSAARLLRED